MLQVPPLPWRRLLSSPPVWACAVATLGSQWGQATLQFAVTKYLMLVYGFALRYVRKTNRNTVFHKYGFFFYLGLPVFTNFSQNYPYVLTIHPPYEVPMYRT